MARNKVGVGTILLHTLLVLITGGLWLLPLGVWFLFKVGRR
jgi:hypothetical protein